ncbi:UNVERIFIED_CONTAM: hypothetical protein FKN15_039811 [Acipenser sinensis]
MSKRTVKPHLFIKKVGLKGRIEKLCFYPARSSPLRGPTINEAPTPESATADTHPEIASRSRKLDTVEAWLRIRGKLHDTADKHPEIPSRSRKLDTVEAWQRIRGKLHDTVDMHPEIPPRSRKLDTVEACQRIRGRLHDTADMHPEIPSKSRKLDTGSMAENQRKAP